MALDYVSLKNRHRALREGFKQSLSLRIHRALSWLQRTEQETDNVDARFISLWTVFNAAYANEIPAYVEKTPEQRQFLNYLQRLVDVEQEKRLYKLICKQFPSPIGLVIDNPYVFCPFWQYQQG